MGAAIIFLLMLTVRINSCISEENRIPSTVFALPLPISGTRLPLNAVAIVTAAYESGAADEVRRDGEYRRGLKYFFSQFSRVVGVLSSRSEWPLAKSFPFELLLSYYPSARFTQKSAKESEGLHRLVSMLVGSNSTIDDDAIVFKASGRYHIVRNDFIDAVVANSQFDVWARPFGAWSLDEHGEHKITPGDSKIFTFYFAMRWRYFRAMYETIDLEKLESYDTVPSKGWLGYDIESYTMDFIKEKGLRLFRVPYLHVVANIDNRGFLNYF
jgi:hypothetical protein